MPAVLFRCDAGSRVGIGHLMRCRALASAFDRRGWRSSFAISQDSAGWFADADPIVVPDGDRGAPAVRRALAAQGADCIVVDHYGLDAAFEQAVADAVAVVAVIDDLADRPHQCQVLVDANPARQPSDYAGHVEPGTALLLGSRYALLRADFAEAHRAGGGAIRDKARRLVIALGGADPANASAQVLDALALIRDRDLEPLLIIGRANPRREQLIAHAARAGVTAACDPADVVALMAGADIAIAGGGVTCLEFACLGIPALVLVIADNQRAIAQAVERTGAARVFDAVSGFEPRRLADAILATAADPALRQAMRAAGRRLVDGRGAERVAEEIERLLAVRKLEQCH